MAEDSQKTCGDCARWKIPNSGCDNAYYISQGTILASDPVCDQFFPARKTKKEKPKKKQLKDSGITAEGCFEAIYHNEKPSFLIKNGKSFSIAESIEVNGETFYPKEAKHAPYEPYGFYEGTVPNREELFWKINQEFQTFVDIEPIWRNVLSACVLLSYNQDKLQTVPYIFVYGDNESGKSTVLQLLKFLCYRPMYGVTVPPADIYGFLEDSNAIGCILEDEVQGIHKDTDKIKIYKAGYKKGAVVPRTIITQHDRIIKYYNTFCFKACASEQIPQVKGFNERFLFISMVEGFPKKEWADITKEDLDRICNLRNMLLLWRLQTREQQLPEVNVSMKGRTKELWKPILQVTQGLTVYEDLLKFAEEQKNERLNEKQNTLEGHIVKVVVKLYNEAGSPVPFSDIWKELGYDLDGKLDDNKPHVMDTSEFLQITKNKVGYRLREILGGKSKTIRNKGTEANNTVAKVYEFDEKKLRRIARKYGFELVTKLPTSPSSESVQAPEIMEKSTQNKVETSLGMPQQLGKLGNSVTNIKAVVTLEPPSLGTCSFCRHSRNLTHQVQYFNDEWADACVGCATLLLEKVKV